MIIIIYCSCCKLTNLKKLDKYFLKNRLKCACCVLLNDVSEEGEAEEVIGHVSRVERQAAVGVALLGGCQGDLAVLHHLVTPVHLADHAHRLRRVGFLHHLEMTTQEDLREKMIYIYILQGIKLLS